jgi:hypothetical protein
MARSLVALFVLLLAGCVLPKALDPTAADRSAIVTIDDFSDWLRASNLTLQPETDSLTKHKIAWSYQLSYEYRGTARLSEDEELTVSIRSEITVHPNTASALHNFNTYALGLKAGLRKGGASVDSVQPMLDWGDGIDLFVIQREGHQIGNGFIGRAGKVAIYVLISGLYSSDSVHFEAALAPALRALERYNPKAGEGVAAAHGLAADGRSVDFKVRAGEAVQEPHHPGVAEIALLIVRSKLRSYRQAHK